MTIRLFADDPDLLEFDAAVVGARASTRAGRRSSSTAPPSTPRAAASRGTRARSARRASSRSSSTADEILHVLDRPLAARPRARPRRRRTAAATTSSSTTASTCSRARSSRRPAPRRSRFHLGRRVDDDRPRPPRHAPSRRAPPSAARTRSSGRRGRCASRRSRADEARARGPRAARRASTQVRVVDAGASTASRAAARTRASTAEVGVVLVTGLERYKGGTRVSFVCGHRALAAGRAPRRRARPARGDALRAASTSSPAAAQKLKDDLVGRGTPGEGAPRARARRRRAASPRGGPRRGRPRPTPPASSSPRFDGWPPADLRALATRLVELAPCVALLGSRADKAHLVFAQSEGLPHDVPALLKAAVESLGGRGGGRGNVAQGGGERLDRLDEALAAAAAPCGPAASPCRPG